MFEIAWKSLDSFDPLQVAGMQAIYMHAGSGGLSLSRVLIDQLTKACQSGKEEALTNGIFRICALLICSKG